MGAWLWLPANLGGGRGCTRGRHPWALGASMANGATAGASSSLEGRPRSKGPAVGLRVVHLQAVAPVGSPAAPPLPTLGRPPPHIRQSSLSTWGGVFLISGAVATLASAGAQI